MQILRENIPTNILYLAQETMKLTQKQQILIKQAPSMALALGITKATFADNKQSFGHLPFTFYPYVMKKATHQKIQQLHYIWQKLFVKVAAQREFVTKLASNFSEGDEFMQRHLNIYIKSQNPTVGVACARVDYMGDDEPKLVEYNLMSIGLNGMSDSIQKLHSLLEKQRCDGHKCSYPANRNQQTICRALVTALEYEKLTSGVVVMIVHEKQFNYGDHAEFKLEMLRLGRVVRPVTMDYLMENLVLAEGTSKAQLDGVPVDAFYFRTGYKIEHFPTEQHWELREMIERSHSIKLPSIDMIIINSKRMQSELAKKQVLLKFLTQEETSQLLSVTGEIYDFDDKTEEEISELIIKAQSSDYVLKPNREGGGNNFMGRCAEAKLKQISATNPKSLKNFILMKKIQSKAHQNYFIFEHKHVFIPRATTEFSTLGAFVYKSDELLYSENGGNLARTKREEDEEGGIAINKGAISGICVTD